jgi:hypothetical protein
VNLYDTRKLRELEGPESVIGADKVRDLRTQKLEWPYDYLYPPPGAIRVTAGADASGTIVVPVAATPTLGLAFTVDEGFYFALEALVVTPVGAGAVLPGDFKWSLTVDQTPGVSSLQGLQVQGFTNVDVGLGTLQIPWPLECPEIYSPNDTIRVIVTNVNIGGGFIKSMLLGWRWPVG